MEFRDNQLKENFNGEVPHTMEGIQSLAGAGRKTANVVLSNAFISLVIALICLLLPLS